MKKIGLDSLVTAKTMELVSLMRKTGGPGGSAGIKDTCQPSPMPMSKTNGLKKGQENIDMLNEIETKDVITPSVFTEPVGKFAERVLFHIQQACNGECANKDSIKIRLIVGVVYTAYELGVRDGIERSISRIRRLLTMKGGGLD